jgi:hypothetical protein
VRTCRPRPLAAGLLLAVLSLAGMPATAEATAREALAEPADPGAPALELALADEGRSVHARGEPIDEGTGYHYNSDYLFGLSRAVAGSTLSPALRPVLFLVTVPLDVALLPMAAIGGLFG